MNIYQKKGYKDRADYLRAISEEYNAHIDTVAAIADLLGPDEDFDGLISSIIDLYGW